MDSKSNAELRQRLYVPPILLKFDLDPADYDDAVLMQKLISGGDGNPRVNSCDTVITSNHTTTRTSVEIIDKTSTSFQPLPPPPSDDRGCLAPCFPACHTPVYRAGQTITGHLLVRPVTRLLISGVTLHISGRCETHWLEDNIRWSANRQFFTDQLPIIRNRPTTLTRRWHRFDVEYQLPVDLPTSSKSRDGKMVYVATASVTVVTSANGMNTTSTVECRARDFRFRVAGLVDIGLYPYHLRFPAERRADLLQSGCVMQTTGNTTTMDNNDSVRYTPAEVAVEQRRNTIIASVDERRTATRNLVVTSSLSVPDIASADDVIGNCLLSAGLSVDRRVCVVGDRLITDAVVCNRTDTPADCTVLLQQVLAYYADYGIEQRGKKRQNVSHQHCRRHIRFVINNLVRHKLVPQKSARLSTSTMCVPAHRTAHFRRSFDLPRKLAPSSGFLNAKHQRQQRHRMETNSSNDVTITSSCDRLLTSIDMGSLLISVKYFCKLIVSSRCGNNTAADLVIPIEVKVGTYDSMRTSAATKSATATAAGTSYSRGSTASIHDSSDSCCYWENDFQPEPVDYEDYFQ